MRVRTAKPALMLCIAIASSSATAQTEIQPGVSGSLIRWETNGNLTLHGKCFGGVSSLPTQEVVTLFPGKGVAKDGNLFFSGSLFFNQTSFPDGIVFRSGSTNLASVTSSGDFYLKGTCVNVAGCRNTTWEPTRWNDAGSIEWNNNCYNYGNDKITNTFAQPGRATGQTAASMTVTEVRAAALRDGLTWVGWAFPGNTYDCGDGHLAFMAVWPGNDYHWWRLDQVKGVWSHKPGHTPARNTDNSSATITNPLTANRGNYTDAGGFYCTCGGLANIN